MDLEEALGKENTKSISATTSAIAAFQNNFSQSLATIETSLRDQLNKDKQDTMAEIQQQLDERIESVTKRIEGHDSQISALECALEAEKRRGATMRATVQRLSDDMQIVSSPVVQKKFDTAEWNRSPIDTHPPHSYRHGGPSQ